jgi:hypothetical protein
LHQVPKTKNNYTWVIILSNFSLNFSQFFFLSN